MRPLRQAMDRWLGRGEASITDAADGRRLPSQRSPRFGVTDPGDTGTGLPGRHLARRRRLVGTFAVEPLGRAGSAPLASFDAEISAVAGLPDGGAAVGLTDGRIVFLGGRAGWQDRSPPEHGNEMHHRARAGARRGAARRQRFGVERAGRLEARSDGEERLRVGVADRALRRRGANNWREIWPIPTAFSKKPTRWSSPRAGAAR